MLKNKTLLRKYRKRTSIDNKNGRDKEVFML